MGVDALKYLLFSFNFVSSGRQVVQKWHVPRCKSMFSPSFYFQVGAVEIIEELSFPDFGSVLGVSILGVGLDGMTTFFYDDPEEKTTFTGMDLPSESFHG
jgi:hypothetical protein